MENISSDKSHWHNKMKQYRIIYGIDKTHTTQDELMEYLAYKQIEKLESKIDVQTEVIESQLNSIRKCLIFFVILACISIATGMIWAFLIS